ncbi:MAG TPA: hypothetical protein VN722_03260 [Hanamia sp.]|nr:hypothetical protein [Hanamia sp.]
MKQIYLISFLIAVFFSTNTGAQVRPVSQKTAKQASGPALEKNAKPTMSSTADSLKMAMSDAKTSFNTLFKGHKDTTTIRISGIEYGDPNLSVLKDALKNMKGIKSVSTEFHSNTITLKVPFKGKPTDLWDQLPSNSKMPFKLIDATDNNITLKYLNQSQK